MFLYLAEISDQIIMLGMNAANKNLLSSRYFRDWPKNLMIIDHEQEALLFVAGTPGEPLFPEQPDEQVDSGVLQERKTNFFKFWGTPTIAPVYFEPLRCRDFRAG